MQAKYSVVREMCARGIAAMCLQLKGSAVELVIQQVIPLLADATSITRRQGAAETVFCNQSTVLIIPCLFIHEG